MQQQGRKSTGLKPFTAFSPSANSPHDWRQRQTQAALQELLSDQPASDLSLFKRQAKASQGMSRTNVTQNNNLVCSLYFAYKADPELKARDFQQPLRKHFMRERVKKKTFFILLVAKALMGNRMSTLGLAWRDFLVFFVRGAKPKP